MTPQRRVLPFAKAAIPAVANRAVLRAKTESASPGDYFVWTITTSQCAWCET